MSELEVFNLAMYFRSEFLRYDRRIFTAKTVKTGRWWKYFEETITMFSGREGWNPSVFVKCQFESFGKIFPSQLPTEHAWNTFKDYRHKFEETLDKEKEIIHNVLTGYKAVRDFCDNHKIDFSVYEFMQNHFNKRQLEIKAYPIHFFIFSKSYTVVYGSNETKRMLVAQNRNLLSKIKEILKEDFI